jgi:transposase, IS5 family
LGVKYVSIPNRNTRSEQRRRWEKQRWFQRAQAWRTGCEGRISVIKRRHGLARCRYHGIQGMRRWVGLGVIADNLIKHRPVPVTANRLSSARDSRVA